MAGTIAAFMTYHLHTLRGDIFGGVTAADSGATSRARLWRRIGPGGGRRACTARSRWAFSLLCSAAHGPRWRAPRPDDHRYGGDRHDARGEPRGSLDHSSHGRPAAGDSRRVQNRSLCGVHAACRRFRVHVRHWHHRHIDSDHAVSRHAPAASGGAMGALRALPEAVADINVSALAIAAATLAVGTFGLRAWRSIYPARWWR